MSKKNKRLRALGDKDREYLESLRKMVRLLSAGWLSAKELADKLDLSHQTPYNRIKKLRVAGFEIDERDDQTVVRKIRRFHITEGDESLLDENIETTA